MRVLMLGWEFPPFISGGLGTACQGLTKALSKRGVEVTFVLPRAVEGDFSTHVRLLAPAASGPEATAEGPGGRVEWQQLVRTFGRAGYPGVRFKAVASRLVSPYSRLAAGGTIHTGPGAAQGEMERISFLRMSAGLGPLPKALAADPYAGDLMREAHAYAQLCVALAREEEFDVIHAHDWTTFPAGLAVAAATGKPLVVHVHSTEFDRSGMNVNQAIYDIERRGMHGAIKVIAVSHLTKSIIVHRYGVDPAKVEVVYNGIENGPSSSPAHLQRAMIKKGDKIVLFMGRITWQKGPEYFIRAAKKVLEKYDAVKFVVAGTGDLATQMIEMAAAYGIGHKVIFTGFLRGRDVERIFKMADLYVMPSVSEPFGIAPLEAIAHDVPVIISKTSGVAEVLTHALKVDFWDVDEMANKIIAVLKHPPLSSTLRQHADMELRNLTWDDAAGRCLKVYESAIALMPRA